VLRGERENAAEERRLAGIARGEQSAFIKLHLEDLRLRSIERKSKDTKFIYAQLVLTDKRKQKKGRLPMAARWFSAS
jgi:hypothetical protein